MNHTLKHGIDARCAVIPGEMHQDLEALAVQYQDHMRPADPVERYLVDTLIYSDWGRRRLMRVQAGVFGAAVTSDTFGTAGDYVQGRCGPGSLATIFKQLNAMERAYLRALTELRRRVEKRQGRNTQEMPARKPAWQAWRPAPRGTSVDAPVFHEIPRAAGL